MLVAVAIEVASRRLADLPLMLLLFWLWLLLLLLRAEPERFRCICSLGNSPFFFPFSFAAGPGLREQMLKVIDASVGFYGKDIEERLSILRKVPVVLCVVMTLRPCFHVLVSVSMHAGEPVLGS